MKGNVIQMNTLHLNSVRLNGIGKVRSVSLKGGSTEDPVFPPIEPEPTPTYTLSASVTNGMVSAKRNGSAVNLPFTANEGDVIVLEVTPNDGYTFEGWNDGNTDNPRTITMNADVVLSAQCVEVVQPPVGNYIQFEDKAVEAICVANWSSDGIGLTEEDAAAVTTIETKFRENTAITSFDELRYFVNVDTLTLYGFYKCSALTSIGLDNIKKLEGYALHSTGLTGEIAFPCVEVYGMNVLGGTSVTSILLPKVKRIINGAFDNLKTLTKVDIGEDCTSIGEIAWRSDSALQQVIVRASTPPSLGSNAFQWTNSTFLIYVPDASLEAYKTAVNWSAYADRIHPLSEIEDYYVSDALLMHLDGINKGNVEGEWQDLVSGNTFVNHGAVAEADGWRFDGASSYMDSATLGTIGWWNKARTLEVVVKFDDISENRTEVVFLSRKNCMAFGRYKSEHFVNSAGLSVPSIKIQSDNGKVIYGYCGNSTSYVRSIINGQQGVNSYGNAFSGFLETTAFLGKRASNDDYFKGKIHAIRIHDRILSEEEILYNQRIDNKRFNLGLDI